jgi:hypothetical protein
VSDSLRRFVSDKPVPDKAREREEIAALTEQFLRSGGKIEKHPIYKVPVLKKRTRKEIRVHLAARSYR